MTSNLIRVPDNMSYVNAFRALWEDSIPAVYFEARPEQLEAHEQTVLTSEKVVQFFEQMNGYFVDYAGGRLIKVNFGEFPYLGVYGYDENFGTGAAREALNKYSQTPSSQRFDINDKCRFSEIPPKKFKSKL